MRFSIPTILLMVVCLAGCRQTTGLNSAGNLTPIGPMNPNGSTGTLTPLGSGQSAALGPFGGATRVSPPPAGSYVAPNNYMGGGQVGYPQNQPGVGVVQNGTQGNQWNGGWNPPVGSGVQQTGGWNNGSANPGLGNPNVVNPNVVNPNVVNPGTNPFEPNQPAQPTTPGGIRSGGMQPIDLTGSFPNQGYQAPLGSYPQSQQPNLTPVPGSQSFGPQTGGNPPFGSQPPAFQNNGSPSWQPPQVIVAPSQANIATAPSTDPIDNQNLQWRRPQ